MFGGVVPQVGGCWGGVEISLLAASPLQQCSTAVRHCDCFDQLAHEESVRHLANVIKIMTIIKDAL